MNSEYDLKECPVCGKKGRLNCRTLDFDYVDADGQFVEDKKFYTIRCDCPRDYLIWYEDSDVAASDWDNYVDFKIKIMSAPQGKIRCGKCGYSTPYNVRICPCCGAIM